MGHVPALRAGMADARGAGAERSSAIHANSIDARLPHENAERCPAQASEDAGKVEIRENPWQ